MTDASLQLTDVKAQWPQVKDICSTPVFMTPMTVTALQRLKQIFVPYSVAYSRTTNNEKAVVATYWTVRGSDAGLVAHAAFCTLGTRSSPEVKQPEHDADHSLPSSIEVANKLELYLCVVTVRA
jgi:hypothetical protein